jgi:hypothetical protein
MEDLFDNHPILFLTGAVILFITVITLIFWPLYAYDCSRLGRNTGRETQFHFFGGGCLISVNGQLIPSEQWVNNSGK